MTGPDTIPRVLQCKRKRSHGLTSEHQNIEVCHERATKGLPKEVCQACAGTWDRRGGAQSIPRGNGKSWLAAHLLTRCLTPGDELHVPGSEYLLCAASIEQARLCYRFIRTELEDTGEYSFLDSSTRIGITHRASNTRLRVLSSNGKTAMGIVNCPLLVADEPGSWESVGGTLMYDAITTAIGKPNSPMRTVFIGTLAPSMNGWWHDLIADGSVDTTYVQALQGKVEAWDHVGRDTPVQSLDRYLGGLPQAAPGGARRGACGLTFESAVSIISSKPPFR